ncbi:MAG TPA: TldD/PmbA family protein [Actinomycetota bacterium]|nr:TldD/PmbA family protein [Actinomycetota bacterium]
MSEEFLSDHTPVSPDEARRAADAVLGHPGADDVEVLITGSAQGLTRYARSGIIQNTNRKEIRAQVRVVVGDRVATASTTQLEPARLQATADRALAAAKSSPPDADFSGLPRPDDVGAAHGVFRWDEATAVKDPQTRARKVEQILAITAGTESAGIFETGSHAFALHSSTGIDCYDAFTRCVTLCLVDTGDATGWGDASSHAFDDVDVATVAQRAVDKARSGAGARDAEPGTYEVVLEAPAVATLLEYLSWIGMGAKQVIEGESFLSTKTGERIGPEGITITDDVWHPRSVGIGFDLEGVPKKRVAVIDEGVAREPVTDLRTAAKLGTTSTGHYSGSNEYGPYASNVVLEGGDQDLSELIGGVSDGILVTRFHYVNVLDRPSTLLTGMTRDGTFRIRGGEVAEPIHNFRFSQSALEALRTTSGIGREVEAFAPDYGSFGSIVAPALRVGSFTFSSKTSH